jgi:YkoY family integral membrane protein
MIEYWNDIIAHPLPSLMVVLNLIIIESLLSVDNAAVLATMVLDLPESQRARALRYGIIGAYVFRGICLLLASFLLQFWWLKVLGGLYLLYLSVSYFLKQLKRKDEYLRHEELEAPKKSWFRFLGPFWSTVLMVEIMDLAFSLDNVFAAVAFSPNLLLIWLGVFIGILAMRFVAQAFVKLLEKYPFLEMNAYVVIFVLGLKLSFSLYSHYFPLSELSIFMEGRPHSIGERLTHEMVPGEILTTVLTVFIFAVPLFFAWLKRRNSSE